MRIITLLSLLLVASQLTIAQSEWYRHNSQPLDFKAGIDTMRVNFSFPNNRCIPDTIQKNFNPANRILSPHSQIYVIDTAIVRCLSYSDTSRHLYSFNASGKRTSDLTQKLKGDIWVDSLLNTSTYDANNNILSDLYEYRENGQWVNGGRYIFNYDANGNMLSRLIERWSNDHWVNENRYTYTYNANGNKLTELYEYWASGQWVNSALFTYTYDVSGNRLSELYEYWTNGQWVGTMRTTYIYDMQGNKLSGLEEQLYNGLLVNSDRWTYTYDASGNMLSYLYEIYLIPSNGPWVYMWRETYTYDADGRMLSDLRDFTYRYTFTYDANGNKLTELYEYWASGRWVNSWRYTYTYNENDNMLSRLWEIWSNDRWISYWQYTCTYDTKGNLISLCCHHWENSSWIPADIPGRMDIGSYNIIDSAGNTYSFMGYNFTFVYKTITTGIESENGDLPVRYSLLQNYPNPFNPSTTIRFEIPKQSYVILKIYDLLGRKITTLVNETLNAGVYNADWNAENYSSGVYFYHLKAYEFDEVKKLILLR